MVLEKDNAIIENRKLMGATDPSKAEEDIRKKYGLSIDKNSVHGSDSAENAAKDRFLFPHNNNFFRALGYKICSSLRIFFPAQIVLIL